MVKALLTEAELDAQKEMDEVVYSSTRVLFEELVLMTIQRAKNGEDITNKVQHILDAYNAASMACQNLVDALRREGNEEQD